MSNTGDGDKRKVTTDALETLGSVIGPKEARDAIHLAVEPTIAKDRLRPGDHVGADGSLDKPWVGIVDPFLSRNVERGERFWLVVYPRQINSLRHVWTHPSFPDTPEIVKAAPSRETSERWLRDFVAHADCPDYETVIAAAVNVDDEEYLHFNQDAHGEIPPEFWDHVEVVTGRKCVNRPTFFSCGC